ncbi:MAG: hypothetical protein CMH22_11940 [Methylophaga sp.]|uniref:hypothetical protein n=1 Tax=Methylophaga sp. UBA678 TaxID=1946901 RepID=UPI000C525912|nr:hypothetical protein [Methylophaga sp. UBA678]MAX52684.1 hypothetical protein [Methylophaga sp.]|tara:strand:+ start:90130 stop:91137 length:1008 start_codon:yes stop_codon:yes gene_type:complete
MVSFVIKKSAIPIVWIDTSIITNMTIARVNPKQLDQRQLKRIRTLYNDIKFATREGKVICPLSSQEQEVWINRDEWMNTIHDLGLGITCNCSKNIQDAQIKAAMEAYSSGKEKVILSYTDMFESDPVEKTKELQNQSLFVTVKHGVFRGQEYQKSKKTVLLKKLNNQRLRNVKNKVKFSDQLKKEQTGELEALIISANKVLKGQTNKDTDGEISDLFAQYELIKQIKELAQLKGMKTDISDLTDFYKSEFNTCLPYNNISAHMYAKIMVDPQEIKSGDPMDIEHASMMLPYVDLFITDKHWRTFLNQHKFDETYKTKVCYIGDTETISSFFSKLE